MRNASVHQADLRMLFQSFGMGDYEATMAIQSAFFLPRTTDPDAQVTILLVKGVQRGLNDLGAQLKPNGILGQSTMDYLRVVSGPLWHGKAWVQIYGDIDSARQQGLEFHKLKTGGTSLGEYVAMGASPDLISLGAIGLGAFLLYRAFGRR